MNYADEMWQGTDGINRLNFEAPSDKAALLVAHPVIGGYTGEFDPDNYWYEGWQEDEGTDMWTPEQVAGMSVLDLRVNIEELRESGYELYPITLVEAGCNRIIWGNPLVEDTETDETFDDSMFIVDGIGLV